MNQLGIAKKERQEGRGTRDSPKDTPPVVGLSQLPSLRIYDSLLPVEPVSLGVGLGRSSGFEPGVLGGQNDIGQFDEAATRLR